MQQQILKNFIVLEGLDGAGTSTQLKFIQERLKQTSVPALITFEPTDSPVGELIRMILKKKYAVRPETLALLFAADREEHLFRPKSGIISALEEGLLVISDRYFFSSLAYQSVTADFDFVAGLNNRFPLPEVLIYLDTPVEICAERRIQRMQEAELYEELAFQRRVATAYKKTFDLYSRSAMRQIILDGTLAPEKIAHDIWTIVARLPIVKA